MINIVTCLRSVVMVRSGVEDSGGSVVRDQVTWQILVAGAVLLAVIVLSRNVLETLGSVNQSEISIILSQPFREKRNIVSGNQRIVWYSINQS